MCTSNATRGSPDVDGIASICDGSGSDWLYASLATDTVQDSFEFDVYDVI